MATLDFCHATLLGSYADRDEYQIGKTLVWVLYGTSEQREVATDLACLQFPAIWAAIPEAIAVARETSRKEQPEFWQVHEDAQSVHDVLSVWGIRIEPSSGVATYVISTNHEFLWMQTSNLPLFPEDEHIIVMRSKDGVFSAPTDTPSDTQV